MSANFNAAKNITVASRKKALFKRVFLCLLSLVMVWAVYVFFYGNFHRVDKDLYRSAQLFSFNMPYYIKKNEIKSVLNLRGVSKDEWYLNQKEILQKYNVVHYDFGIGDRQRLSKEQMDEIVKIIERAPKPILLHCKRGADRTSLASALYLYAVKGDQNAEKEFSILYGHFPWLGSKTKAKGESFRYYKAQMFDKVMR